MAALFTPPDLVECPNVDVLLRFGEAAKIERVSFCHSSDSFSTTAEEATWVLTSYLVANAIVLPITGWLSRRFGRKNLLMTSVVGFTAASFFCGLAPTLPLLVFFRVVQGAAGG